MVLVPLEDRHALGRALHRRVVAHRMRGDHHPARVDRQVAGRAADAGREPQDLRPGPAQVHPSQLRQGAQGVEIVVRARIGPPQPGQFFGDPADLAARQAEHPRGLADGQARLQADVAADHGRAAAEARQHRGEHPVALVPGKVDVDVRRVQAAGVEEPLEVEVVAHRADIGDAQAVGHQRGRARAAAAGAGKGADDVAHHQEIAGKAHGVDHRQLVVEAAGDRGRQGQAVASLGPGQGGAAQFRHRVAALPGRQHEPVARGAQGAGLGDMCQAE